VPPVTQLPRLRQAVVAARELEPTVKRLQDELGLGEPYNDPAVGFFGLRNAVFALGDTFLEVVSPIKADTAAGRLMQRRGGEDSDRGLTEVVIEAQEPRSEPVEIAGVRFVLFSTEEHR
jgi:hypothetical protein